MPKIAVGGFFHESNAFSPLTTTREDFLVFEREEIFLHKEDYPLAAGILDHFSLLPGYEAIPLVFARAVPNGEVDTELYRELKAGFFRHLRENAPVDAFVLPLHGSMRVKGIGSAETDLLRDLRKEYPGTPIFCGLDMHATLTEEMLSYATACVGFKTAPHVDAYETGRHIVRIAQRALETGIIPRMAWIRTGCLIAGEKSETDCEPMRSLIAELRKLEADPRVLAASYLLGFPWADAEGNGATALVVTASGQLLAQDMASALAALFLERKDEFGFSSPALPPREALDMALNSTQKPFFVSDSGDNPTAGATADNTTLIDLLNGDLASPASHKKVLVAGIYDPQAYHAFAENPGRLLTLRVGGNFDTVHCQSVELSGTPIKHVPAFGPYSSGLILFRTTAFDLIITSRHIGFTGTGMFHALDIDPLEQDVIVVKLGYLTPEFKAIAAGSVLALTRGCTDEVLSRLAYSRSYELI
jgi:microcystin degradation protein MlrC